MTAHATPAPAASAGRFSVPFLNWGHALDHLAMLIFPTAVLAMAPEMGMSYAELLPLALGGFIAFGAGSLPAGWLGDRWSRRAMMVVFFVGIGAALVLTGLAAAPWQIAAGLTLVGLFASIYHPIGIAMLVNDPARVGRSLGVNGVAGNLGVAAAALVAGALCDLWHWRAAFIVPGGVAILSGLAYAVLTPRETATGGGRQGRRVRFERATVVRIFAVIFIATACAGVVFNAATIAMPKLFDERIAVLAGSGLGIGLMVSLVYVLAAMAQLIVGQLIDRYSLKAVFLPFAAAQPPLLWLAAGLNDWALLAAAIAIMFVVFGLIPVNDAMVARYTDERWRSRVYAVKYVFSFGASAMAVPLIAAMHASGGFRPMFVVLGAIALGTLAAAVVFPARPEAHAEPAALPQGAD